MVGVIDAARILGVSKKAVLYRAGRGHFRSATKISDPARPWLTTWEFAAEELTASALEASKIPMCDWCGLGMGKPARPKPSRRFHRKCARWYHRDKRNPNPRKWTVGGHVYKRQEKQEQLFCRQCSQPFPPGWPFALKIHPDCRHARATMNHRRSKILVKAMTALLEEQGMSVDQYMEGMR